MALATVNRLFERPGRAQIFLADAPTVDPLASPTGVAATDNPLRLKAIYELFYADGDARKALKAGVLPYANVDASGILLKTKANEIEYDPNDGPKHTVGLADFEQSITFSFADADIAHLKDIVNAGADDQLTQAPAVGKAGRSTLIMGNTKLPKKVVALIRMPSVLVPGEYDNILLFRSTFTIEADEKFSKKDTVVYKVMLSVQGDAFMVDADGTSYTCARDNATAAAL